MATTRARSEVSAATPPLLFADLFALTSVDARAVARSKPCKHGFFSFDAKPPQIAVRGSSQQMHLFDEHLRPIGEPHRPAGALLPDGLGLLTFASKNERLVLTLGDSLATVEVPDAPREISLSLGPSRGTIERDFPRDVTLAPDSGVALPMNDRSVRLGHLDLASRAVTLHAIVRFEASHATKRAFLPGRDAHVLAALDRATDTLELAVVRADGAVSRHTHRAIALPARDGESLWVQRDERTITRLDLDGNTTSSTSIPDDHAGAGAVFAQRGEAWFVPWHAEVVVALTDGRVIARGLPGDTSLRRHVARLARHLHDAGREANLGLRITSMRTTGGAHPTLHISLSGDGGDEGPLAHSVMGAAVSWNRWCPPPGAEGHTPTGGWIIAARTADTDELIAALGSLDAHGLALRDAARHWAQIYSFVETTPFTDEAAEVFARVLLDRDATVGTQREAGLRARTTPWDDDAAIASLSALRASAPSHDFEILIGRVIARHRKRHAKTILDAMIAAHTTAKGLDYTGIVLAALAA